ncbi:hypothetical protein [Anaerocellum danielii]|uniref:Uncharacterized protein n=1 Tax=Anaerocellum danielii TaxID=1387557 RepID=A0ABZ0U1A6_9FIRM|nr:hypothetical protein [Caldicellulosiruptor danielii]WPX08204.1 hypothetical protein SOJ16_002070 [Caldicellulosiruptor danielii]
MAKELPGTITIDGIECELVWKTHSTIRRATRKIPEEKILELLQISPEILDYPHCTEIIIQAKWFAPVVIVKCTSKGNIRIHLKTVIDKPDVKPKYPTDVIIDKRFFE